MGLKMEQLFTSLNNPYNYVKKCLVKPFHWTTLNWNTFIQNTTILGFLNPSKIASYLTLLFKKMYTFFCKVKSIKQAAEEARSYVKEMDTQCVEEAIICG